MNGVQMPGGTYKASTAAWVTGEGFLVVSHPAVMLLQVQ